MSTQGFLDLADQVDEAPDAVDEPGVADILAMVKPLLSQRPANVRFGSFPVNVGTSVMLLNRDPSRSRMGVGISAVGTGSTVSTLAYVSDAVLDGSLVGGLRYISGVQLPVINSGSDYLILETTGELYVTVPATATAPVYVSFFAESFSAA